MAVSVNCGRPTGYICKKAIGLHSEEEPVKHRDDGNKEKKTAKRSLNINQTSVGTQETKARTLVNSNGSVWQRLTG